MFLARNGKEGILAARDLPDIVILDVDMPGGVNGFKVLETLREEPDTKKLPVIMLTSTPPLHGEQIAMDLGVSHYLTKPWSAGTVEIVVRVALREAKVARGEGGDFSEYVQKKKKEKKAPEEQVDPAPLETQPEASVPGVIDDRKGSPNQEPAPEVIAETE